MEEYESPRVRRLVIPSPLRGTPSSSKDVVRTLYSTPVPPFVLDLLEGVGPHNDEIVELPKHYLRDFSFRLIGGFPDPTPAEFREVASHFPGCRGVAYMPPFLVVTWAELPVKPWPLTLGGVPLFYATIEQQLPPTFGRAGGGAPVMKGAPQKLKAWVDPGKSLVKEIVEMILEDGIGLRYFGWCGTRWYAEVVSPRDGDRLPRTICGLVCVWKIYEEHEEGAWRTIAPDGGAVIDTTWYSPELRPGVRVESVRGTSSTSGVPLVGPDGQRWITVAEHYFKMNDEGVHHPNHVVGRNNLIATVQSKISNADIALARLDPGLTYSATSFDGDEADGTRLEGLVCSEKVALTASLFLDSAYNGKCEGIVTAKGMHVFPWGHGSRGYDHIQCNMVYFGNGAKDIFPGTCGCAMWTQDNEVAAFFRWYSEERGIAYSPCVDVLIEKGYKIEAISCDNNGH